MLLLFLLFYFGWIDWIFKGVESEDCGSVAKLVGFKVFVNEFVAYTKLGATINFRDGIIANHTYPLYRNGTLPLPADIQMIWNVKSSISTDSKIRYSTNY